MSPLRQRLQSDGFANLGVIDPTRSLSDVASGIATSISAAVVDATEQLEVSPRGAKGQNTYGGNYGLDALPFHTDLAHWHRPPRYVLLRSKVGSKVVHTRLIHRRDLEPSISASLIKRAMFSPRRRLEGKMYLLHMLTDQLFRWDELFLEPKNQPAIEVRQRMLHLLPRIEATNIALEQPGHTLLVDNWHAMHGRGPVPATETARRIERLYLEDTEDGHEDTA
jgi:L-asparagine oxygenase